MSFVFFLLQESFEVENRGARKKNRGKKKTSLSFYLVRPPGDQQDARLPDDDAGLSALLGAGRPAGDPEGLGGRG